MLLKLPKVYSQKDSRWAYKILGFNKNLRYNIYNYGCLITCLSMIACYFGHNTNPGTMNKFLKDVTGFSNGGFYNWGYISRIFKDIKERWVGTPDSLTDAQINEIKEALDNGFPVMVQLDSNPRTVKTDMHYGLLIGYDPLDENNFTMIDPIDGKIVSTKRYLGWWRPNIRRSIEQFIIYEGKVLTDAVLLEEKIAEMAEIITSFRKDHEKKLSEARKKCQNRLLEVKKALEKIMKTL